MHLLILGTAVVFAMLIIGYLLLWLETRSSSVTTVLFQRIPMLEGGPLDGQKGILKPEWPSYRWILLVPRRWSPVAHEELTVDLVVPRNAQSSNEAYPLSNARALFPDLSYPSQFSPELYCVLRYEWKPGTRNLVYVETYAVRLIQCKVHGFHALAGDTLPLYIAPSCSLDDLEHAVPYGDSKDSKASPRSTKNVQEIAAESGL